MSVKIFSANFRKRKFQTLFLILFIIIVYFLLQFFSLSRLGNVQMPKKTHHQSEHLFDAVIEDRQTGAKELDLESASEEEIHKPKPPRGVLPSHAEQFAADSDGMFICLVSKKRIPITRLNDDFCDCADSSDEPGTNACPNGRFYCKIQIPHQQAQFIDSSKVNDGICDCCDGSDEWSGHLVPSNMQLHGKSGAVFHTPCDNHCGDIERQLQQERKVRKQGRLLHPHYVEAAQKLTLQQRKKFGPGGVFYLLSSKCFEHKTREYTYDVCPFDSVTQNSGQGRGTVLGRHGIWLEQNAEDYVLKMGGGDAQLCPDGQSRQVLIRFLCGVEDSVIDVREDQVCRYIVRFKSPAAC